MFTARSRSAPSPRSQPHTDPSDSDDVFSSQRTTNGDCNGFPGMISGYTVIASGSVLSYVIHAVWPRAFSSSLRTWSALTPPELWRNRSIQIWYGLIWLPEVHLERLTRVVVYPQSVDPRANQDGTHDDQRVHHRFHVVSRYRAAQRRRECEERPGSHRPACRGRPAVPYRLDPLLRGHGKISECTSGEYAPAGFTFIPFALWKFATAFAGNF